MDMKEKGNDLFKSGDYVDACEAYSKALVQVDEGDKSLRLTILNNRAQCLLKLEKFLECVKDCTEALSIEHSNIKALFRRAQGYMGLRKVEDAFRDLRLLLELDKKNNAAMMLMKKLRGVAQDLNSNASQAMEVLNSVPTAVDAEKTSKIRHLLGSILDDEHLGASLCNAGACSKLWALRSSVPTSLKILSKFTEYDSCYKHVLKDVELDGLETMINEEGDGASASLNICWRLAQREDEEVKNDSNYTPKLDQDRILELIVFSLRSDNEALRRIAVEGCVRLCGSNEKRCRRFMELGAVDALKSMIARDHNRDEPVQQVSVVLGQVLASLKDDDLVKKYAVDLCKDDVRSIDVHDQIRGVAALDAIFYANKELGEALINEDDLLDPLKRIARLGAERGQALTSEVFSHLANSESGRALLAGDATEILKLLAVSDSPPVRSSAAVTLAKLNAIDFNAESENGMLVLSSVTNLLQESSTKQEHAKGVEAVSFVITDAQVKMMLMKGQGLDVLKELIALAKENAKEHYAYGLSFIFENLTMTEDDKRREKLREMEVTEEQWDQFEKLTKSQTRKPGQEDPREQVEFRINAFVQNNGIAAIRSLVLNSKSEKVCEAAARTLCNIASVKLVRGQMIAQGALRALFKLTSASTSKAKQFAAHALGKIFVTTDPHVLKDEQLMDTIGPLVRQVRHCDEDLVVFECCMALTNIATVSFEAKQKMINAKGIQAFEYAQYNENLMVRRAATEALNNLIPCEEVVEWISKPEKMKLWLLFCQSYEEDVLTACAATGALANLGSEPKVAEALAAQEESALEKLVQLVECGNGDIAHRAVVCLLNLVDSWPGGTGKAAIAGAGAEKALRSLVQNNSDSPAVKPALECIKILLEPSDKPE